MSENEEDIRMEMLEQLGSAYRFSTSTQIFIYMLIILGTITMLYFAEATLKVKISLFLGVSSLLFPYIIKVQNKYTEGISISLFATTFLALIIFAWEALALNTMRDLALYIAFMEILGIELLHHVAWTIRMTKTVTLYVFDAILSGIFFVCMVIFFWYLGIIEAILISTGLTIIFGYAILPERPF
ncbi:MAG: hypothetical protein ACP6IQ_02850 [Candidatus Njordarchaeia archaeon]